MRIYLTPVCTHNCAPPTQQNAVPGEPLDVQATPLNSTSIYVSWKPPQEKDQHGIIRGYHIHLQELKEEVSGQVQLMLQLLQFHRDCC